MSGQRWTTDFGGEMLLGEEGVWIDDENEHIATAHYVGAHTYAECLEVAKRNAHLIAAAPELLAALKLLAADVADYPAWNRPCHALDVAEAAIRLAETGERS